MSSKEENQEEENIKFVLYDPAFGNLLKPSGRINRMHYFIYMVATYIALFLLVAGLASALAMEDVALFVFIIGFLYFAIILTAKRLHDINLNPSYIIPIYCVCILLPHVEGILNNMILLFILLITPFIINLILLFKKGTPHKNRYGEPPLQVMRYYALRAQKDYDMAIKK